MKVYAVPLVSPVTVQVPLGGDPVGDDTVQVLLPGDEVTVKLEGRAPVAAPVTVTDAEVSPAVAVGVWGAEGGSAEKNHHVSTEVFVALVQTALTYTTPLVLLLTFHGGFAPDRPPPGLLHVEVHPEPLVLTAIESLGTGCELIRMAVPWVLIVVQSLVTVMVVPAACVGATGTTAKAATTERASTALGHRRAIKPPYCCRPYG